MFKNKKNQLDEMQEQKLLHIEKNGFWFAFWALGISIIVQMILFKGEAASHIAGEWLVFMCMCVYQVAACLRAGIWDRRLKPDAKTNAIISVIAGLATAVINSITFWVNLSESEDRVVVNYKGTLIDGTEFDANDGIEFGASQVIPGWTEGLGLLGKGGKATLYIPSNLAYGERAPRGSKIEPNSALIFEVEVVDIIKPVVEPVEAVEAE